mmetsp:Transcript_10167/g.26162  ORF Transcript_10167/g.26162 Transcript_10167/m.26162 type:complete len:232 (-) Transcript_10167:36-731(-)
MAMPLPPLAGELPLPAESPFNSAASRPDPPAFSATHTGSRAAVRTSNRCPPPDISTAPRKSTTLPAMGGTAAAAAAESRPAAPVVAQETSTVYSVSGCNPVISCIKLRQPAGTAMRSPRPPKMSPSGPPSTANVSTRGAEGADRERRGNRREAHWPRRLRGIPMQRLICVVEDAATARSNRGSWSSTWGSKTLSLWRPMPRLPQQHIASSRPPGRPRFTQLRVDLPAGRTI